jgi:transcription-repair coupling factor (superfamily II helicase)
MEAKAGGIREARTSDLSPQITTDAPVMIPDTYVPDLDLRMGLYRRINELENVQDIEAFAAELIDRFGKLPEATENLLTLIQIKLNARKAHVAKIDLGPRGALVSFWNDNFPNVPGLLSYVEKLNGIAKLRPDMRLAVTRAWNDPKARLHGALQLSKGLAKILG